MQFVVDRGCDKDVMDNDGRTALHVAAVAGSMAVAQALLSAGADVSLPCTSACPHSIELLWGHVNVTRVLLERGADINAAGLHGRTPLHVAANFDKPGVVSLLSRRGSAQQPRVDTTAAGSPGTAAA